MILLNKLTYLFVLYHSDEPMHSKMFDFCTYISTLGKKSSTLSMSYLFLGN